MFDVEVYHCLPGVENLQMVKPAPGRCRYSTADQLLLWDIRFTAIFYNFNQRVKCFELKKLLEPMANQCGCDTSWHTLYNYFEIKTAKALYLQFRYK